MQSQGTVDLFFFQQHEWFRNEILAQACGLIGPLLADANEWRRGRKREEPGRAKEREREREQRWRLL